MHNRSMKVFQGPINLSMLRNTRLARVFAVVPVLWMVVGSFCICLDQAQAAEMVTQQGPGHCHEEPQQPKKSSSEASRHQCGIENGICLSFQSVNVADDVEFIISNQFPPLAIGSSVWFLPRSAVRNLPSAYDYPPPLSPEHEYRILLI